ncbi:unnamed protein product [Linum trigynum]|uniref:Uncharacterized protein n=1 Tax=Linum trigynum TaxID=586398 RepID=A0AAV2GGS6_9ROSI
MNAADRKPKSDSSDVHRRREKKAIRRVVARGTDDSNPVQAADALLRRPKPLRQQIVAAHPFRPQNHQKIHHVAAAIRGQVPDRPLRLVHRPLLQRPQHPLLRRAARRHVRRGLRRRDRLPRRRQDRGQNLPLESDELGNPHTPLDSALPPPPLRLPDRVRLRPGDERLQGARLAPRR